MGTLKGVCTPVRRAPSWERVPACTPLLLVPSPQQWQPWQGSTCVSGQALVTCGHSTLNSGRSRSVLGCSLPSPCTLDFQESWPSLGSSMLGLRLFFWKMEQQPHPQWTVVKFKGVCTQKRLNQLNCPY